MNRGKRAITLDLTVPDGVALAKALVKDADAVIENYSAEVLRKFGLDYAELAKVNPALVMVSMAAFGGSGPWRETRAYGSTLEQGSGLPSVGGRADDPPMMNHLAYGDAVGGLNACSAMLVALLHRRETGEGQFIDLSQVQCMPPFTAAWAIEQSAAAVGECTWRRAPATAIRRSCRTASFRRPAATSGYRLPSPTTPCGLPCPPHGSTTCARHGRRPPRPGGSLRGGDRGLDGDAFAPRSNGELCRRQAWRPARSVIRWNCSTIRTLRRAASGNGSSAPMSAAIRSPRRLIAKTRPHRRADACCHARPYNEEVLIGLLGPFQDRAGAARARQRHRQRSAGARPAQGAGDEG